MKKILLLRYGEIHLKGKNKNFFEKALVLNIKSALAPFRCFFERAQSRYVVSGFDSKDEANIISAIQKVAGLHSISPAFQTLSNQEEIKKLAVALLSGKKGTFRVTTNRADKTFPLPSMEFSAWLGGEILEKIPDLKVDLHAPNFHLFVDIRENGKTFVFFENLPCLGGMPVGTSGKALLLLSGGIDSPVAGFRLIRRGMKISAVHFESFPHTSRQAEEKAKKLAEVLAQFNGSLKMFVVSVAKIQNEISKHCDRDHTITLLRRFMLRIAQKISLQNNFQAIITGDSLGQVASQTIESLTVIGKVCEIPILRPLISMDKAETIGMAKAIGTFDISVTPFDDCCTVFLPESPVIKPKLSFVLKQEAKLDIESLVNEAVASMRVIDI